MSANSRVIKTANLTVAFISKRFEEKLNGQSVNLLFYQEAQTKGNEPWEDTANKTTDTLLENW